MNKSRIIVPIISFLIFAVFYIFLNYDGFDGFTEYFKSQNFDEIALKYYDDTEFDHMSMYINHYESARSTDKEKFNKLLNHFKTLEYKRISRDKWYSLRGDIKTIWLFTEDSGSLGIKIYNEKYIMINLGYIIEKKYEEKNLTKIYPNNEYKAYKVVGGKIDMDLIKLIYDSMEIEEY
ncbi:hypothetical protein [Senegalia massiliensis]|uniref:Uncharacterized protein n=1 Tax=Senegalia massiliensis TaxID=1720316 RepID=A0A845R1E3_9CLOT|nr:hypothetical protein [Senegalia massiliensis]NBI07242.1 hypothetical protein [Senegalia massiliensis]